jgi:hypothetical protein
MVLETTGYNLRPTIRTLYGQNSFYFFSINSLKLSGIGFHRFFKNCNGLSLFSPLYPWQYF